MTEKHQLLTDQEFEDQFKNCTLAPTLFSHEAHLRLAYIHIKKYGLKKAISNICRQIKRFDIKFGDSNTFNKTVTVASTKVVNHFMNKSKALNFNELTQKYPRLKSNFLDLLKTHYRLDIFKDPKAKLNYLEPDLLSFSPS